MANDGVGNVGHLEIAGGAISAGADVRMQGTSTLDFVAGASAATGKISVDNSSQVTGNVPSGITIEISANATLRSNASYTNAGTIRLVGGGAKLATQNNNAADAETLTNTGTLSVPAGGTNGARDISGDLLNQGSFSITHPSAFFRQISGEARDPKLTNTGTLTVASGAALNVTGQSVSIRGNVQVSGQFNMNTGYVQTGGTTELVGDRQRRYPPAPSRLPFRAERSRATATSGPTSTTPAAPSPPVPHPAGST